MEQDIAMLQAQTAEARKEAEDAYLIYSNLKATYLSAEQVWLKTSRKYKNLDYKLAEIDGRLKKVAPSAGHKTTKAPELTLAQLQDIAKKLGVTISVEEPAENVEETEEYIDAIMEDV